MPLRNIALVTCSTRSPRLNPFITNYTYDILLQEVNAWPDQDQRPNLSIIDLADQNLPLYNELAIPSHLPSSNPTPHYVHEYTRAWSTLIRQYDAFIFVTPQYNWSIPAVLKNALDYLFWEWKGKPAGIVTYGGRGGGKAGGHLRSILTGLRLRPVETSPGIVVGDGVLEFCSSNGGFSEKEREEWKAQGVEEKVRLMLREIVETCPYTKQAGIQML